MMEKKAKSSGNLRRLFFRLLGSSGPKAYLSFVFKRRFRTKQFGFPVDVPSVKDVLLILPDRELEVLYQLKNVISLVSLFKNASVTLLSEQSTAHYFKMIPGLNIIEYYKEQREAFSNAFTSHVKVFRDSTDICILLDRNPDLPLLYFTGSTGASVRAAYSGAGEYPFVNLHINPGTKYLPDRNCSIARTFGASLKTVRWTVAKRTIEELNHLLKELKIPRNLRLIGIDVLFFLHQFGTEWTEDLLAGIKSSGKNLYLFVSDDPETTELEWLRELDTPLIPDLSVFKNAALVNRSEVVITGNTLLYALAGLMNKPAIGFFREDEIETYCPNTASLKGIPYNAPDREMIDKLVKMIGAI